MRHRFTIWDACVVLAAAVGLLFFALEYDVLRMVGIGQYDAQTIEFGEVILIALVLGALLFVAFRRMRAQQREVARRTAAERKARELAFQDPLTGLANRRQFDEAVAAALAAPPGVGRAHAVMLLDLNGFKAVNDLCGHPTGDMVLNVIAMRLSAIARDAGDLVSRLGGDEFGILATQLRGTEDASGIALRVIEAISEPIQAEDTLHNLGVGVGIAMFPRDGNTPQEIVRRADVALYRAKSEPGSNLHFFEEEMDTQLRERAMLEAELRVAVANGDIRPYYQPIVKLGDESVTGFEVVPRWHHKLLNNVPPERFMPIAESTGLIRKLSDDLLRTACTDACKWPDATLLSFKVSSAQLRDKEFGLRVLSIIGETGLAGHRLEIEVSETALVRDFRTMEAALGALRAAGVKVALNDFGTGYSSLYHLRNFKVDRIKIDRTFVERMSGERESATIVRALLGLGRGLGVEIAAEGIQSDAARKMLAEEGCEQGQGYFFSDALPASAAEACFDRPSREGAVARRA